MTGSGSLEYSKRIEAGKQILGKIRSKWPVDEAAIGGIAIPPCFRLLLPQAEWNRLTQEEKINLTFYAESMVGDVRAHPHKYLTDLNPTAPAYSRLINEFQKIKEGAWRIDIGRINDDDKMKLMVDETVVKGDIVWNSEEDLPEIRSSSFRGTN